MEQPGPGSVRACGGDGRLHGFIESGAPTFFLRRRLVLILPPRGDCGLGGGAVRYLLRGAPRVVLAEVLVEDCLEREALSTDVAVERLVACVFADVVLQLVLAGVLLSTDAAHEGRDAHVQAHVPVQAAFLVKGLAAVNASETRVITEPAVTHLLTQILLVATHVKNRLLFSL